MSQSEVARLRHQIEQEIAAMHLLMHGPSLVSKHEIIARRNRNLSAYHQQLSTLVGEEQAMTILYEEHVAQEAKNVSAQ